MFELRLAARPGVAQRLWEEWEVLAVGEADGVVVAGFADRAAAMAAAAVEGGDVRAVDEADQRHLHAWRAWARPTRVGRLVVRPAWLAAEGSGRLEVAIDPGPVFGHGGHPSTRLVLGALESRIRGGESVLDVGCGSGVLAVAALALGAGRVTACDIDPAAVAVTRANAAANGVADRVDTRVGSLGAAPGRFDVVVANIGVVVLRTLGPALAGRVAAGGWLALSGLLEHQWTEVVADGHGLEVAGVPTEDGWAAPILRRPLTA